MARRRCYFIEVNVCKFWNETGDFFLIILVEAFLLLWLVRPFPTSCASRGMTHGMHNEMCAIFLHCGEVSCLPARL